MAEKSDKREVVITIKDDSESSSNSSGGSSESSSSTNSVVKTLNTMLHPIAAVETQLKNSGIVGSFAYQLISETAGTVKSGIEYSIHRNWSLSENYISEREVNNAYQAIQTGVSFGSSLISGITFGSAFGPIGTIAGAVIGVAGEALNFGFQVYKNYDQAKIQLATTTYNLNYSRERAGYALTNNGENTYN